jgi:hypothetical protein
MNAKNDPLTQYQTDYIQRMKELNISYVNIAFSLDIGVSQAKTFVCRHEFTKDLSPKTIVKKRITDGRIGLEIKRICLENPRTPIRKYTYVTI